MLAQVYLEVNMGESSLWDSILEKLGSQASNFGNKLANPSDAFNQYMKQQPQQGGQQQGGQQQGGGNWQKFAQPIDTSAGLSAAQPSNPMYGQMMQQVMQQQPQQQRQPMTSVGVAQLPQTGIPQATMPQMPGAIHPNEDMMSLFRRLMGGA
jgi:hypothetical protein